MRFEAKTRCRCQQESPERRVKFIDALVVSLGSNYSWRLMGLRWIWLCVGQLVCDKIMSGKIVAGVVLDR